MSLDHGFFISSVEPLKGQSLFWWAHRSWGDLVVVGKFFHNSQPDKNGKGGRQAFSYWEVPSIQTSGVYDVVCFSMLVENEGIGKLAQIFTQGGLFSMKSEQTPGLL